jgi:nickel-dependent lactate racemase
LADTVIDIGFGKNPQKLSIPEKNLLAVLLPNKIDLPEKGPQLIRDSLARPIGSPPLGRLVKPGEKVAVVTSDLTRPLPSREALPPVLDELEKAGIRAGDITVIFALGSHRPQTEDERRRLVGEAIFEKYRCLDSDPDDCLSFGRTSAGTPVDITRAAAEADRRIGVSNIEYHYFAGYSGGAKALMPGVSTRAAIQSNHSRMVQPGARAGQAENNPVRADIEEAVALCPLDFIVIVVLDEHKEIVHCVSGHFIEAHRAGCAFLDRLYLKPIDRRADIVIASQGGAPKDLNLYQTQKALDNAKEAVRPGGVIILVGSCREGLGEKVFEEWMLSAKTPASLIERIRTDFQLGGHKAAAMAMVLARNQVYLVSEMDPELVRKIFLKPFRTVQEAFEDALEVMGPQASALVMPYAGSTLPAARD